MTNANYEQLLKEVEDLKVNADKFFGDKGIAQAGKRLRANAQNCVKFLKGLRKDVSTVKTQRVSAKTSQTTVA